MPPITMFPKRRRPKGLEVPSCRECNLGASPLDVLASSMASIGVHPSSEQEIQHFSEKTRQLVAAMPQVADELWRVSPNQYFGARRYLDERGIPLGALSVTGPLVSAMVLAFGARCALALHWRATGSPLSATGSAGVIWYTNANAIENTVPQQLFEALPTVEMLRQGKNTSAGLFEYSSGKATDANITAHWITFGTAFMFYLFVGETMQGLQRMPAEHVFRPGFLKNGS